MTALISMDELALLDRLLEEHRDRADAGAAERAMADDSDEMIPFRRATWFSRRIGVGDVDAEDRVIYEVRDDELVVIVGSR